MLNIPIQATPSQQITVVLAGQRSTIKIYEKKAYAQYLLGYSSYIQTETGSLITAENDVPLLGEQTSVATLPTPAVYMDLSVNDTLIIGGVRCLHAVPIVRDAYLGFSGDLAFFDTQGMDDPVSSGLGARWVLGYYLPVGG